MVQWVRHDARQQFTRRAVRQGGDSAIVARMSVDVWDTEADWERFRDEVAEPIVGEVLAAHGLPHDESLTRFEELAPIDVWVGTA